MYYAGTSTRKAPILTVLRWGALRCTHQRSPDYAGPRLMHALTFLIRCVLLQLELRLPWRTRLKSEIIYHRHTVFAGENVYVSVYGYACVNVDA